LSVVRAEEEQDYYLELWRQQPSLKLYLPLEHLRRNKEKKKDNIVF
jgi:hypothetical protein